MESSTSGITHKAINNPNWGIFLYALNMVIVLIDLSTFATRVAKPEKETGVLGAEYRDTFL